jgi:thioredoxin reductase
MTTPKHHLSTDYDYVIIGAGPGGLQLGYFLHKAQRNYLILEANSSAGSFFKVFPRHRKLISSNKVYTGFDDPEVNLRFDWNSLLSDNEELLFKNFSKQYFADADDLVRYFNSYADHYRLNIKYETQVVRVSKNDRFRITDRQGNEYSCRCLIVASGLWESYLPPIPGIERVEQYADMSIDPNDFLNQTVLILGKGNSGFETADNLIPTAALIHVASPHPVKLAWRTHFVGHLRAINNNFIDTYQLKSQNGVLDATIEKIEPVGEKFRVLLTYTHAKGQKAELFYDHVIACTGFRFDDSIFDESCRPELVMDGRLPAQTSEWESTNVKDLYIAGTLMQVRDYKKVASGFMKGFRYNLRTMHLMFEQKYHGNPLPYRTIDATVQGLADAVLERINRSSALWQQFGFLCDLVVLSDDGRHARYYEELPVDYVHDSELGQNQYYVVTLDFGEMVDDPLSIPRDPDPRKGEDSKFLHPVIRYYSGPNLVSEHHITEDLYSDWSNQQLHVQPFLEFLVRQNQAMAVSG